MAETSYFWDNAGTGDSPAGGYGHTEMMTEVFRMLLNGTGDQGVLEGWLNELEVTDGGGLNASVAAGGAVAYGFFYENDAAATVALPDNQTNHVVAQCSWAAQTVRLAYTAALTQTAGTTWDIPLAEVTTAGGAITLVTDERDYCEFSTSLIEGIVTADYVATDAVTTTVLENQTRSIMRGAGALEPDATNTPSWHNIAHTVYGAIFHSGWECTAAATKSVWLTCRVPPDFTGTDLDIYIWTMTLNNKIAAIGDAYWTWSAYVAAASAVLANQTGNQVIDYDNRGWSDGAYQDSIGTITVSAGDLVHLKVSREGGDASDTDAQSIILCAVELSYTADS